MFSSYGKSSSTNFRVDPGDVSLSDAPGDTVQRMRFNNYGDVNNPPKFLAAASWDGSCKVWEIAGKLTGYGMSQRLQVETKYCGE